MPLWLESWVPLLVLISITSRRHGQGNEGDEGEGGRRGTCARSKAHEEGHEGHEGEGHEGEEVRVVRRLTPALQRTPVVLAVATIYVVLLYIG